MNFTSNFRSSKGVDLAPVATTAAPDGNDLPHVSGRGHSGQTLGGQRLTLREREVTAAVGVTGYDLLADLPVPTEQLANGFKSYIFHLVNFNSFEKAVKPQIIGVNKTGGNKFMNVFFRRGLYKERDDTWIDILKKWEGYTSSILEEIGTEYHSRKKEIINDLETNREGIKKAIAQMKIKTSAKWESVSVTSYKFYPLSFVMIRQRDSEVMEIVAAIFNPENYIALLLSLEHGICNSHLSNIKTVMGVSKHRCGASRIVIVAPNRVYEDVCKKLNFTKIDPVN